MSKTIREADAALKIALTRRLAAGQEDILKTLMEMVDFVPDSGFPLDAKPLYGDPIDELDKVPFFTETYLYNLIGKEDARTVLAYLGEIARALGFEGLWEVERLADDSKDD